MSAGTVDASPVQSTGDHTTPPPRRRRRIAVALVGAALLVTGSVLALTGAFTSTGRSGRGAAANGAATSLATVARRTLSSQAQVSGTLSYVGTYTILNNASGVFTRLPSAGEGVKPGQPLYWVNGKPIALLQGDTPAYRTLGEGMSGADVKQLNADLVKLGYATWAQIGSDSDYFSASTVYALERLQGHLGVTESGQLTLGDAVFEPGPIRMKTVTASLGGRAGPGAPLGQATTTARQVHISLDASQQADVRVGDRVAITLPDKSITPGVVSSVGTVATSGNNGSTVDVYVRPSRPRDTGSLDEAPVQVAITTGTAHDALVVPVSALLALASGGYAVEQVDARGRHQLIPVTLGLFDDADGLVQIHGAGLNDGQHVVIPLGS